MQLITSLRDIILPYSQWRRLFTVRLHIAICAIKGETLLNDEGDVVKGELA